MRWPPSRDGPGRADPELACLPCSEQSLALVSGGMRLTVNGEPRDVPDQLTVRGLIEHLGLTEGPVAVERNRLVVPRAEHESTPLTSNDVIEIVHFVGGG